MVPKVDKPETESSTIRLIREMAKFNNNFKYLKGCLESFGQKLDINTSQVGKLKTELKKQTQLDEKNQKFLQDIIQQLIDDKTLETKEAVKLKKKTVETTLQQRKAILNNLGNILNWAIKLGILVLLAALGFKELLP